MQQDAYDVVCALAPEPPQDPDPQAVAYEAQQALFAQEKETGAWTAPLGPARAGRQRVPVPSETAAGPGAEAAGQSTMCILGSDGSHTSRGLHCPHNLPAAGDPDEIISRIEF